MTPQENLDHLNKLYELVTNAEHLAQQIWIYLPEGQEGVLLGRDITQVLACLSGASWELNKCYINNYPDRIAWGEDVLNQYGST